MKKNILFAAILAISVHGAQAQLSVTQDILGVPISAKITKNFVGNEYLYEGFVKGHVLQQDSTYFNNMTINYNIIDDRPVFFRDGQELAFKENIKEFQIIKPKTLPIYLEIFRNGFPATGNYTTKSYYLVLNSGNTLALKKPVKSIIETTPYGSAKVQKTVVDSEQYFLFKDGKMVKVKRDKKNLTSVLSDKRTELMKFIDERGLTFKTDEDIQVLLTYYNSLPTI